LEGSRPRDPLQPGLRPKDDTRSTQGFEPVAARHVLRIVALVDIAHSEPPMKDAPGDRSVLKTIQELAAEEHRLYNHEAPTDADRARLANINIELDQCWDLLRQRQALRDAGRDPNEAHVRPPEIVENYDQ
jgi:hypothetical protein